MTDLVPSTPSPSWAVLLAALIRSVLGLLSAFGFTWALTVSGSQIELIASAIIALSTVVWSLWQKFTASRVQHTAAVASALRGRPVEPATPPIVP